MTQAKIWRYTAFAFLVVAISFGSIAAAGAQTRPPETTGNKPLAGTQWRLVGLQVIGRNALAAPGPGAEPILELQGGQVVNSSVDCNQLMGFYQTSGNLLHFSELAMTAEACLVTNDPEQGKSGAAPAPRTLSFVDALKETSRFRIRESIRGARLELLDESGTVLAWLVSEPR